jgi:ribosome-associated translation inhibitor RaiA/cold shock CspA family protein
MHKPLQIAFRNMDCSPFLEALVRERVAKLERHFPDITGCRIVIEIPHRSPQSGKLPLGIAVEVDVPGRPLIVGKAEEVRHDMKAGQNRAVSRAFEAVQRQLQELGDIRVGAVKQHDGEGEAGVVVRMFPELDYGFVEVRASPDLYFSRSVVVGGDFDALEVGSMVQVTRASSEGPMGPQASSVRRLDAQRSVA